MGTEHANQLRNNDTDNAPAAVSNDVLPLQLILLLPPPPPPPQILTAAATTTATTTTTYDFEGEEVVVEEEEEEVGKVQQKGYNNSILKYVGC